MQALLHPRYSPFCVKTLLLCSSYLGLDKHPLCTRCAWMHRLYCKSGGMPLNVLC